MRQSTPCEYRAPATRTTSAGWTYAEVAGVSVAVWFLLLGGFCCGAGGILLVGGLMLGVYVVGRFACWGFSCLRFLLGRRVSVRSSVVGSSVAWRSAAGGASKVTDQITGDSGQKSKVWVKGRGQRPTGKGRGPPTLTRLTVYRLSEASVRGPQVGETRFARPFYDSGATRSDAKRRQGKRR